MAPTSTPPAEPAAGERKQILKISTLAPTRPTVEIDDVEHEFRLLQEFGSTEHQQWTHYSRIYDRLWSQEKLTKAEVRRRDELLDWLFDHALLDAGAVRKQLKGDDPRTGEPRLSGAIKREIVLTFTNAPLLMEAMAQQGTPAPAAAADETETEGSSTSES